MAQVGGELREWHKVVLEFEGPRGREDAATFLDHRLDVVFRHEGSGREVTVPGHFAADGDAADSGASSGTVWRAHFNPPEAGRWTWEASFRTGDGVAVAADPKAGASGGAMDGETGSFRVLATDKGGEDLRGKGVLEHDGDRYLSFAGDGSTFLKSGVGSPENFLAYSGFDNTPGTHSYKPHLRHFEAGDPTWDGGEGRGILGAVNYLADQGVNSAYMLLMNVGGDGQDVWPWAATDLDGVKKNAGNTKGSMDLGEDARAFDVSKLDQWERVFEHMQERGITLHLFLQETENDFLLNDGEMGTERALFMREMVARFGHHNGIIWNLGEETTNTAAQTRDHAQALKQLDPYDHPVALHTYSTQHERYDDFLGEDTLDVLAFQTNRADKLPDMDKYVDGSAKKGKALAAFLDEPGTSTVGAAAEGDPKWQENHDELRETLWTFYMDGGSGVEWYFGYRTGGGQAGDLNVEDFSTREGLFHDAAHARAFFEDLPLGRMKDADGLTSGTKGADEVLAEIGKTYAIFLPNGGGATLDLSGQKGAFDVTWFDPLSGKTRDGGTVAGGDKVSIGEAPYDEGREWAVTVEKTGGKAAAPKPSPIEPAAEKPSPSAPTIDKPEPKPGKDKPTVEKAAAQRPDKEQNLSKNDFDGDAAGIHRMKDDLVVMQAEDGAFVNPRASGNETWELETDLKGYKGDGYLLFDTNKDYFSTKLAGSPATGPLEYTFRVEDEDAAGKYFITLRGMKPDTGEPSDRNNDFYVAAGPADEDPSGWKKLFFSGGAERWLWGSTFDASHKKSPATFEVDGPGDYTIYVSGRSRQAGLDEIHVQKGSKSTDAKADSSPFVKGGSKPDPRPEPKPDPKPDPKPEPKPDPKPEPSKGEKAQASNDVLTFGASDVEVKGGKGSVTFDIASLLRNDSGNGRVEVFRDAMDGTVELSRDGSQMTYEFDLADLDGKDAFSYRVFGANGSSDIGRAYLEVSTSVASGGGGGGGSKPKPEPEPKPEPVGTKAAAKNDALSFDASDVDARGNGGSITFDVATLLKNDGGHDGGVEIFRGAMDGEVSLSRDGSQITYEFGPGFDGKDAFSYRVTGADGSSDHARVYLDVSTDGTSSGGDGGGNGGGGSKPGPKPEPKPQPAEKPGSLDSDLTLVDSRGNAAVVALAEHTVIDADAVKGRSLTAMAEPDRRGVESVELSIDGEVVRVEGEAPYALFGDRNGNFRGGLELDVGDEVELGATYYGKADAKGRALGEAEATIAVQDDVLTGRKAADVFVFDETKMGRDTVRGFEGRDALAFIGGVSAREVLDRAEVVDGDTVIDFGGGDVLTLKDFANLGLDDVLA